MPAQTGGSTRRTGRAGRRDPAGRASAGSPGSGPSFSASLPTARQCRGWPGRFRCRWSPPGACSPGGACRAAVCCQVAGPGPAAGRAHCDRRTAGRWRPARGPEDGGCRPLPSRWEQAGRGRSQAGRDTGADLRLRAGRAPGGPVSGHGTGRAAADRRARPQNPWRERIPLRGCHRPDRHFPALTADSRAGTGPGCRQPVGTRLPSARRWGSHPGRHRRTEPDRLAGELAARAFSSL
jgi:hypothetical protein